MSSREERVSSIGRWPDDRRRHRDRRLAHRRHRHPVPTSHSLQNADRRAAPGRPLRIRPWAGNRRGPAARPSSGLPRAVRKVRWPLGSPLKDGEISAKIAVLDLRFGADRMMRRPAPAALPSSRPRPAPAPGRQAIALLRALGQAEAACPST